MADYGIVILTYLAAHPDNTYNTRDIATLVNLPLPVVSKVLKLLGKSGLVISHRGIKGGYGLARSPNEITVADIIGAVEGPIAVTECNTNHDCELQTGCPVRTNWHLINRTIQSALEKISLAEMTQPIAQPLVNLTMRPEIDQTEIS